MKLFTKTSLYYLFFSIPVLIIAGLACYFIITSEVDENNNELLLNRKIQIEKYLQQNDSIALQMINQSGEAIVNSVNNDIQVQNIFSDTLILDLEENELAPNRLLYSIIKTNHGNYSIRLWRSTLEFPELFTGIMSLLFIILVFFFFVFLLINWWISKTLWKPFYKTLERLQSFRVSGKEKPLLESSSIQEFKTLNNSVSKMMDKIISDFKSQKEFAENASHEMQTPLAIIKAKTDLLIQSEKLGEKEMDIIVSINNSIAKLSQIHKSLLLLTKIENRQFINKENVSLNKIIDDSLNMFEEHIQAKRISVTKIIEGQVSININADLCLILINNLLQNAIRHNKQNGMIEIVLNEKQLIISNSGQDLPLDDTKLFERFQKNSSSDESLGLGLAIAKEIADASSFLLQYKFESVQHHFILSL